VTRWVLAAIAALAVLRRRYLRWGARDDEMTAALPGDRNSNSMIAWLIATTGLSADRVRAVTLPAGTRVSKWLGVP
jgi:hypothetical protein